ncbi:MAG: Holliday junction resolvase RuvX [Desulfobulbaceae bacterium]|nr:Holliday junction resolvase RuvX [Candidatus Kapabacteria bacterium]MBS4001524.1 Holliday junction resolvase RuvX [Desulfobulbaceae bacterium]
MKEQNNPNIIGKRVAAIDFGLKRVGFAYCDELHISITPFDTLDYHSPKFWGLLNSKLAELNIKHIVVGVPIWHIENESFRRKLFNFINKLSQNPDFDVFTIDESFTSQRATETMIEIGKKKSTRSEKGQKDKIAAALILRDFLDEYGV